MIYDSVHFPATLRNDIYRYIKTDLISEKKASDTEDQFLYKTRKKGFGPFKKDLWHLPAETLRAIGQELENQFSFLFTKLKVNNTSDLIHQYIKPVDVPLKVPEALR